MKRIFLAATLLLPPSISPGALPAGQLSRSFEFRAVSSDAKAVGETDFKGKTATLSTEERVAFLKSYADFASAWFGDPGLDTLAVPPEEARMRLAQFQSQPLPVVRRSLRLEPGWRQAGGPGAAAEANRPTPWRDLPGAKVEGGSLWLPAGQFHLIELTKSAGWRCELSWRALLPGPGTAAQWKFGEASEGACALEGTGEWHAFRLQADFTSGRGYLSRDGVRVAEIPLAGKPPLRLAVETTGALSVDDLLGIDYRPAQDVQVPYTAVVLADDRFEPGPDLEGWTGPDCRLEGWTETALPAVRGGFREAGEDLYLRRSVDLPAAKRVWLEIEALDPSGEVHLNGKPVAAIPNRRPVFLEVTPHVKAGPNLLALKVNHFVLPNPMHHSPDDRAVGWFAGRTTLHLWPGETGLREFRVHTEALPPGGTARQRHRVLVDHAGGEAFTGTLVIAYRPWFPAEGPVVATQSFPVTVPPRSTRELALSLDLPAAERWSPGQPALYAVSATLLEASGQPLDDVVATTGIRTVAQDQGQLLINGVPAMLNGAQIMGYRPAPAVENSAKHNRCAPAEVLLREMLAIQKMGGNLLRVHVHAAMDTPDGTNDPRIAEMADQLGLALIWCSPSWIREGDERRIDCESAGSYIRQVYNHPSILVWEMSNHPNTFKEDDGPERTHEFVRRTVRAVLAEDTSRLVSPTTFWQHTHYGNDLGTVDRKGRPLTPVAEYTHPRVTRGTQDAVTGYGAEWSKLREWPEGLAADCLQNGVRAWFNFEHEESAAQPNWNLSAGWPWHRIRSYEAGYEKGSIGRQLALEEWRASQAWQAFSAAESMRKQIFQGVDGFSWCTIEGGANSGTYEKPLLDPLGHAKLAWHIHKLVFQPILAGSGNADVVYGPGDRILPCVFNLGPERVADLTVAVKSTDGRVWDKRTFPALRLAGGRSLLQLPDFQPKLPASGYCVVEYTVAEPARN